MVENPDTEEREETEFERGEGGGAPTPIEARELRQEQEEEEEDDDGGDSSDGGGGSGGSQQQEPGSVATAEPETIENIGDDPSLTELTDAGLATGGESPVELREIRENIEQVQEASEQGIEQSIQARRDILGEQTGGMPPVNGQPAVAAAATGITVEEQLRGTADEIIQANRERTELENLVNRLRAQREEGASAAERRETIQDIQSQRQEFQQSQQQLQTAFEEARRERQERQRERREARREAQQFFQEQRRDTVNQGRIRRQAEQTRERRGRTQQFFGPRPSEAGLNLPELNRGVSAPPTEAELEAERQLDRIRRRQEIRSFDPTEQPLVEPVFREPGMVGVEAAEKAEQTPVLRRFETGVGETATLAAQTANIPAGVAGLTEQTIREGPSATLDTLISGGEREARAIQTGRGTVTGVQRFLPAEAEERRAAEFEAGAAQSGFALGALGFPITGVASGGRVAGVTGRFSDVQVRSPIGIERRTVGDGPAVTQPRATRITLQSPFERTDTFEPPPAAEFTPEEARGITQDLGDEARQRAEEISLEQLPFESRGGEVGGERVTPSRTETRSERLVAERQIPGGRERFDQQEVLRRERQVQEEDVFIEERGQEPLRDTPEGLTPEEVEVLIGREPRLEEVPRGQFQEGGIQEVFTGERRIIAGAEVTPRSVPQGITLSDIGAAFGGSRRGQLGGQETRRQARLRQRLQPERPEVETDDLPEFNRPIQPDTPETDFDVFGSRRTSRRTDVDFTDDIVERQVPGRTALLAEAPSELPRTAQGQETIQETGQTPFLGEEQRTEQAVDVDLAEDTDLASLTIGESEPETEPPAPRNLVFDEPSPRPGGFGLAGSSGAPPAAGGIPDFGDSEVLQPFTGEQQEQEQSFQRQPSIDAVITGDIATEEELTGEPEQFTGLETRPLIISGNEEDDEEILEEENSLSVFGF